MRYLSVCAGIEAATCAWHPLGWTAAAYSEIEPFPRAVLAHHYPKVPLHGDFTTIRGDEYGPIDLLVGGTPCQDFSVAGLRAGLDGERGNLTLEFVRLADRTKPDWVVWENVPGVLSIDGGRAFGAFLGGLAQLGYGFAYRVLDAQYFGLAQRRARVFVVGYLGDWRRAAAVLFERESLRRHPAPRREAGEGVAGTLNPGAHPGSYNGQDAYNDLLIPFDTTQITSAANFSRPHSGDPCHPLAAGAHPPAIAFSAKDHGADAGEISPTLRSGGHDKSHANGGVMPAVAFYPTDGRDFSGYDNISPPVKVGSGGSSGNPPAVAFNITPSQSNKDYNARASERAQAVTSGGNRPSARGGDVIVASAVRRLTPRECERLQGFKDDYTLVPYRGKPAADGPRYKALGNSMAVPCMFWIGQRIQMVEDLVNGTKR